LFIERVKSERFIDVGYSSGNITFLQVDVYHANQDVDV
jgi:hypothetical protein